MNNLQKEQIFITKSQVCELLQVSLGTVNNYIAKGYLTPLGFEGRVLFDRQAIIDSILSSK